MARAFAGRDAIAKCRVGRERDGTRWVELPGGYIYRIAQDKLAEVVVETLTEPDPPDYRVALLQRLCSREEWTQAVKMAHDIRTYGAVAQ
jgi:hypothetical protein